MSSMDGLNFGAPVVIPNNTSEDGPGLAAFAVGGARYAFYATLRPGASNASCYRTAFSEYLRRVWSGSAGPSGSAAVTCARSPRGRSTVSAAPPPHWRPLPPSGLCQRAGACLLGTADPNPRSPRRRADAFPGTRPHQAYARHGGV